MSAAGVKITVTAELANRYSSIKSASKQLKVSKEPLDTHIENSIKRALDLYEMNHLEPAGHKLSSELLQLKSKKRSGSEKAQLTREERRTSLLVASNEPQSIHHLFSSEELVDESNSASVKDFNRQLKKIASVVSVVSDEECSPRKLKAGVNDLVMENGWSGLENIVQRVFANLTINTAQEIGDFSVTTTTN